MKKLCPKCEELLIVDAVGPHDPVLGRCSICGWTGPIKAALGAPKLPPVAPKMPYVSIDIETTGLDPETCQTLEVGAVIDDWKSSIDQLSQFRRILIHKTVSGNPYAMALNANLLKQIANPPTPPVTSRCEFCKPEELCEQFAQWIKTNGLDPRDIQAAGKKLRQFRFAIPQAIAVV